MTDNENPLDSADEELIRITARAYDIDENIIRQSYIKASKKMLISLNR